MFGNYRFNSLLKHPGYNDPGSVVASVAGSVISGALGSDAASSGAQASADATAAANARLDRNQVKNEAAFLPYKNTGLAANSKLADYLGLSDYGSQGTPLTYDQWLAQNNSSPNLSPAINKPISGFNSALLGGGLSMGGLINQFPHGLMSSSVDFAKSAANADLSKSSYQKYLDSFTPSTGQHDSTYGSLLKPFTNFDLSTDPGYQFRLDQGTQGIDRASAARGGYDSGATLKALARYNQDYAAGEFGNAFNRDQTNKTNIYNFLSGMSNQGLKATSDNASVNNGLTTGAAANTMQNGANQGVFANQGASAWNNAIQGGIGNILYGNATNNANSPTFNSSIGGASPGIQFTSSMNNNVPWYQAAV